MIFIMDTKPWLTCLQQNGYRLTAARKAVVEIIAQTENALNPLEVYEQARRRARGLGLVTVYRTLEKLEETGLIQRVHQPGGCNAYLPSAHGHQHLIICQKCGHAEYFEGDDMQGLFEQVANRHGFNIREHWLQLFGTCRDCQKN
jgi:Fe2+ or Zn2+ uptake regulation protein